MTIRTYREDSSCKGKVSYNTYVEAQQALKRSRRRSDKSGQILHIYACQYCPKWHLGHQYGSK